MAVSRETWFSGLSAAACAAALAIALGAERFLGLVPCAFCLIERKPYYAGLVLGLLALALPRRPARFVLWVLVCVILAAAALSLVHTGVEQHWWPDPLPECTVPDLRGMNASQRLAAMPSRPAKPCEDPDYLVPGLPVSMTQMSLAYGLAFSGLLAISLARTKRRKFR